MVLFIVLVIFVVGTFGPLAEPPYVVAILLLLIKLIIIIDFCIEFTAIPFIPSLPTLLLWLAFNFFYYSTVMRVSYK